MKNFTKEEQTVILEIARVALADAVLYDDIAEDMDLSDEYMKALQLKIENATNEG
jgi:hypothetical protein